MKKCKCGSEQFERGATMKVTELGTINHAGLFVVIEVEPREITDWSDTIRCAGCRKVYDPPEEKTA